MQGLHGRKNSTKAPPPLPEDTISIVLRHIGQRRRLVVCTRVSRAWSRAAAAASSTISANLRSEQTREQFEAWMRKYGSNFISVEVTASYTLPEQGCPTVYVPFQQLQGLRQLQAKGVNVQPQLRPVPSSSGSNATGTAADAAAGAAADTATSDLTALRHLTSLSLASGSNSELRWLSGLTALQQLHVLHIPAPDLEGVLPNLQQLHTSNCAAGESMTQSQILLGWQVSAACSS